jgi:large subunit ribosomal protein L24
MEKRRWRIRKGDLVQVITGKDKGKQGIVTTVLREAERLLVSGIMMVKRHTKANRDNPSGGIIEKESTIHVSNVMLVDPKENVPTRVGVQIKEDGTKVRVSKKSGTEIKVQGAQK